LNIVVLLRCSKVGYWNFTRVVRNGRNGMGKRLVCFLWKQNKRQTEFLP